MFPFNSAHVPISSSRRLVCDVMHFSQKVPAAMLEYASARAEKRCVVDLAPRHIEHLVLVKEVPLVVQLFAQVA